MTAAPGPSRPGRSRELSLLAALAAILVALAWRAPRFFSTANLADLATSVAPALVAAMGMTLVILARQIDISIGSQFAVCGVVMGLVAKLGLPVPLAAGSAILAGASLGAMNGALVAGLGLPSIVVTLATMVAWREGLRWATEGTWVRGLPESFQWLGLGQTGGRLLIVGTAAAVFALFAWGLTSLRAGRSVYATGSDAEAARLLGLRPRRVVFAVFVLMGALAGLAAVLTTIQFIDVQANAGVGLELRIIAAVVVGGVAISGGRGSSLGVLLGVLFLAVLGPALVFLGGKAHWDRALQGAIILLAVELVVFALWGHNFLTVANAFEVVRASVELGLLALALTAVIATGGIDLSVGSLLGLCAVVFGWLAREAGVAVPVAAALAVLAGTLGGLLNGWLVTSLRLPPLIVTLGTYSLYRGLAEAATGGVANYTGFPDGFLGLGQGTFLGGIPAQLPLLLAAGACFWALVHRSVIGRGLEAIGYAPEAARHAGVPVGARLRLVYVLSGTVAGVASLVYVARLGQAKADAGTGFELLAITAVVLGGTSIFGGRASVPGTLLGLFVLALLQNGLRLSDQPAELAGILTGVLLLLALALSRERKTA